MLVTLILAVAVLFLVVVTIVQPFAAIKTLKEQNNNTLCNNNKKKIIHILFSILDPDCVENH